jgi:hypothetical protein
MKWLLLLILISCGKQQAPKAVDMIDSDGDLKPDILESESERYIANFQSLGLIKGTITFLADSPRVIEFTNASDLNADAMKLLVGTDTKENFDQYFSEWSQLKLNSHDPVLYTKDVTKVFLDFKETDIQPDELVLKHGKKITNLGKWSSQMRLDLTKEELESILNHSAVLALRKKFESHNYYTNDLEGSIKNNTFRVYFNDGTKSNVLYVAKKLKLESVLKYLEIPAASRINEADLFFNSQEKSGINWYFQEYSNGDKVFVKTKIEDVKKSFLAKFKYKQIDLKRENGSPVTSLELENQPNMRVFLKVRPLRTMRTFSEQSNDQRHNQFDSRANKLDKWWCTYFTRTIANEVPDYPTYQEFLQNLNVDLTLVNKIQMVEQIDEKGPYWEIMMLAGQPNITFSLLARPATTFTTTGKYDQKCRGGIPKDKTPSYQTNDEGKLSFEIESYVEKPDQKLYN